MYIHHNAQLNWLEIAAAALIPVLLLGAFFLQTRTASTATTAGAVTQSRRLPAGWLVATGAGVLVVLLAFRAAAAHSLISTVSDFFDSAMVLSLLLLLAWAYYRITRQLRSFAPFLLPMVAILMIVGLLLSFTAERHFHDDNPWTMIHVVSVLLGLACFAVGCVAGAVYLLSQAQLRRRGRGGWTFPGLPPLDRLERFTRHSIVLGFPLLTLAAISGIFRAVEDPRALGHQWYFSPKVLLTFVAWLVYASLLHVKLAPALRGSRCAWLSVLGFALLLTVLIAANWMPHG